MMINFKHYYRQAIARNRNNLDEMVRAVWAIWKHKVRTTTKNTIEKLIIYYRLLRTRSHIMSGVQLVTANIYRH